MQFFLGTKAINAKPMTRIEYNNFRGWDLPADEDGSDDGYLVENLDSATQNMPDYSGYVSWSPVAEFESAYQASGAFSYGHAVELMKKGHKVARAGWNGKDVYVTLIPAGNAMFQGKYMYMQDCFGLAKPDNTMQPGWVASIADLLAEDWCLVK